MTHKISKGVGEGGGFLGGNRGVCMHYDKVRTGQGLQNIILNMHQNHLSLFEHGFLCVLPVSLHALPLLPSLYNNFLLEGGKGWVGVEYCGGWVGSR